MTRRLPYRISRLPRTSAGVLYFCLLALLNTTFFPTIQESLLVKAHERVDSDSSLLEVIMENVFQISAVSDYQDDEDDIDVKTTDLFPYFAQVFWVFNFSEQKNESPSKYLPSHPVMEILIPPPKKA